MTILKHAILLRNPSPSPVNSLLLSEQIHHQLLNGQSVVEHLPNDSGPLSPSASVASGHQQYILQPAPVLEQLQPQQQLIIVHQPTTASAAGDVCASFAAAHNFPLNQASTSGQSSSASSPFAPSISTCTAFNSSTCSYPSFSASSSPMTGDLLIDDRSRSSSSLAFGQLDTQLSPGESSSTSQVPSPPPPAVLPATTADPAAPLPTGASSTQQSATATHRQNYGKFIHSVCLLLEGDSCQ